MFGAALALPVALQSGTAAEAAEGKGKGKGKEGEGPIHHALRELKAVKLHLEKAPHDFGGHKVQALKDVNAAHASLEKALEFEAKKGA
ncbi:MAG: hypothetical protein EBS05_09870 [Proteobacteria bacterium]|nr:hypothetical protein [Pseudomonadota bacterium]